MLAWSPYIREAGADHRHVCGPSTLVFNTAGCRVVWDLAMRGGPLRLLAPGRSRSCVSRPIAPPPGLAVASRSNRRDESTHGKDHPRATQKRTGNRPPRWAIGVPSTRWETPAGWFPGSTVVRPVHELSRRPTGLQAVQGLQPIRAAIPIHAIGCSQVLRNTGFTNDLWDSGRPIPHSRSCSNNTKGGRSTNRMPTAHRFRPKMQTGNAVLLDYHSAARRVE